MEREYDYKTPLFFCKWEDTCGLWTLEEMKKELGESRLFEKDESSLEWEGIGWKDFHTFSPTNSLIFGSTTFYHSYDVNLPHFVDVIEYLLNDDVLHHHLVFTCDNMRISRVV
tara:strand:- start:1628 stop:1966 length:339 start_codon:yes stop_codon:yes gene_type:complete